MAASAGGASADGCGRGGAVVVAGTQAPRDSDGARSGGVAGVGNRYAAQGYRVTYVEYPTNLWPLGPISYNDDVAVGKAATERAIIDYQSRCPGRPVVVAGYSQGARVAGDVLSDAANGRSKPMRVNGRMRTVRTAGLSGELYSDPRRDGRGRSAGVENTLIGLIPGILMSGPRDGGFGSVPVTQVCVRGDGVCDVPDPLADPIGAVDGLAGYWVKHGYYPARMGRAPSTWGQTRCVQQGTTRDCVVEQRSSLGTLTGRIPQVGAAVGPVVTRVVDRRVVADLPEHVRLSTLRPLVGAGPDSSSGDLGVEVRVGRPDLLHAELSQRVGSENRIEAGLGAGPVGVSVGGPTIDARRAGDVVLNPSNLMGRGAPDNAVLRQQTPTEQPTVEVRRAAEAGGPVRTV
ncbi:cutinase family protein [Gordonia neofelifaecis]|uniref:Uncharacterized protein n=1 Tax=Gordonia neofelifaecis NRRL B-59395 TaxID=644548 RepID=F1YFW4_9ACTN|nr:PE-PPE domain-containing protein [Gordonia neofelifaecis]EGD56541.1 hypothetical protein SCNU_03282 [Gordonia neofelifaecis NRRL B-59395]